MKRLFLNTALPFLFLRGYKSTDGESHEGTDNDDGSDNPDGNGGSTDNADDDEGGEGGEGNTGEGLADGYDHIISAIELTDDNKQYHAKALNDLSNQFLDIASSGNIEERKVFEEAIEKVLSDPSQMDNPSIKKLIQPWIEFLKVNVNPYISVLSGDGEPGDDDSNEHKVEFKKEGFFNNEVIDFTKVNKDNLSVFAKEVLGIKEGEPIASLAELAYNQSLEKRESAEAIDKYNKISAAIDTMPLQLKLAVGSYLQGEDWTKALVTQSIVTEKEFSSLTEDEQLDVSLKLTDLKIPEGVTKENNPDFYNFVINAGKLKYEEKRSEILRTINGNAEEEARKVEEFNDSIKTSISNLKNSFKGDISDAQLKRVEKSIKDGIINLFIKDGKLLPDAAEKVAYMLFAKEVVSKKAQKIASSSSNKTAADVITRPQSAGASRNTSVSKFRKAAEDPHIADLRRQIELANKKKI